MVTMRMMRGLLHGLDDTSPAVGVSSVRSKIRAASSMMRTMGRISDDYENLGLLGSGAAGKVYAARHRQSGRQVAIKSLLTAVRDDPKARERFAREGKVRLDSPYVVQVHEARVEDGTAYLVMERVEGTSLRERLQAGPLPLPDALRIAEEVALGLAVAHRAGIVHRDIKPANLLLTPDGSTKITDFGIAKLLASNASSLTASGQGMGTLTYVSPEQAENAKHVSPAADLYSLGATLYHLLAGRPPFLPSPNIIMEIFEDDPPPLGTFCRDCPKGVAELVRRLLEKVPDDRTPNASAVANKLREERARLT